MPPALPVPPLVLTEDQTLRATRDGKEEFWMGLLAPTKERLFNSSGGAPLAAPWIRTCLPAQGLH